jgi:hypothetical protein
MSERDFNSLVAKSAEFRAKAEATGDNPTLKAALEAVAREHMRLAHLQKIDLPRAPGIE